MHIRGKWLIEMAELHAMSRSEMTATKAFLTRRIEQYRPSYGRKEAYEPRQSVFIGTTNKSIYLRDETGNRRFWPIRVGKIDLDRLRTDHDQLFAEAIALYRKGEPWWPDAEFERQYIEPEQDARYEADAWEDLIAAHLQGKTKILVGQIARDALAIDSAKLGTTEQRRIATALERLGWQRGKRTSGERWWELVMTQ